MAGSQTAALRLRLLLVLAAVAWFGGARAQSLEIITLHYRPAEQMLPQLLPMLEPGAALTGTGDKLFVRTSPRNLADLRRVVEELDRMPRRLMISVRQGAQRSSSDDGASISGELPVGRELRVYSGNRGGSGGGTVEIRRGDSILRGNAYDARSSVRDDVSQQVQTIEGGRAWIDVGQSIPLPLRQAVMTPRGAVVSETTVWRDVGTGFYAEPRLSGDRVTLEISPTRDAPGAMPGSVNIQHLSTTVSGRLGEWIELGASTQDSAADGGDPAGYRARASRDDRRVWLRVEELP
ncbi:MAG TPA: hypothetical protein VF801_14665 [Rhodocyclaceae bacterium]